MEDRDWRILQVLFEHKNITKTAQALFISQPALTARLRNIEEEFGIKIVYRTSKGVHFTPQGEYLAKSSADMLFTLRKIKEQVIDMNSSVAGTLRLGASSYFTMYMLPKLLKGFKEEHPHVEFKLTTTWSRDIFNLVHNQDIHIGFVSSDYGWQSQRHLLFEEPICIASASEININDLPKLPRINYQTDSLIKAQIDKWWRENFSEPPSISMEVDKLSTCKEMVVNGLGYGIMPSMIINNIDSLHKILLTDKEGNHILRRTWMLYHEELLEMNIVSAFVHFVKSMDFPKLILSR
ncbi:MAG: yofA 2 [Sporomusa sp.]|jgi:DNA-binding transcriptional LysR family regulator|nr:yofA 2 [Sporomusa sp.]